MSDQNNEENFCQQNESIFEVLDNDIFVNYLFENQTQQFYIVYSVRQANQQLDHHTQMKIEYVEKTSPWVFTDYVQQNRNQQMEQFVEPKPSTPKQNKPQKQTLLDPNDDLSVLKNSELFNYKNNLKNTYINKISSLMNQPDIKVNNKNNSTQKYLQNGKSTKNVINKSHNSSMSEKEDDVNDGNEMNNNVKLLRNRECARNSRKRKKVYIELLENKVKSLSDELDKTKKIILASSSYFTKISQDEQLQGFFLGRQQLFEKLDKAVKSGKDNGELNLLLDSMRQLIQQIKQRFRVGGGGKERVNAGNYFFNQILDICFPIHVRYLLWSSSQNKDLFFEPKDNMQVQEESDTQWCKWSHELLKNIKMTDQQKKQFIKSKKKLVNEKMKLEELLIKFQDVKEQIYLKTSHVENFVDELRNNLTPPQTAQLLIGLEKNKYRREMNLSKIWDIFDDQSDQNDIDIKEEDLSDEDPQKKVHM